MSPTAALKLAAFTAVLAVVLAGAALAGGAIGPEPRDQAGTGAPGMAAHGDAAAADDAGTGAGHEAEAAHGAARPVRGLAVAEDGLRLVVDRPERRRGVTSPLRLRIVDDAGATVRDFDVAHERRLHLIVVRRDLTGFQHLHPRQAADGSWTTPLRLGAPGAYRVLADFERHGEPHTLGADLRVDGAADLRATPAPRAAVRSDAGDLVRLDACGAAPGEPATLRFSVGRGGAPVALQPYLGARGHLVALREGDLAFLHVHPEAHDAGGRVTFQATFPTAGRYRLFLQYRHAGEVRTAAVTVEVR